jgi:hypothetical protein
MAPKNWFLGYSLAVVAGIVVPGGEGAARASVITYETPAGSQISTLPVDATATFTTSANQITLVLDNLIVNPTSVAQNISDLLFSVSSGQTTGSIDPTSSGTLRTLGSNGTYSDSTWTAPGHWALRTSGGAISLNDLTGGQPRQTIIGSANASNRYSNANGSLTGSTHNPFLFGPVTFVLDVQGVTAASTITSATFSFNTEAGSTISGVPAVPEPASTTIIVLSLASLGSIRLAQRCLRRSPGH